MGKFTDAKSTNVVFTWIYVSKQVCCVCRRYPGTKAGKQIPRMVVDRADIARVEVLVTQLSQNEATRGEQYT